MNVHVINRAQAWPTAKPFIATNDLVIWTDTAGIGCVSAELKSNELKIVCLYPDDAKSGDNQDVPVISDQAWVQYVLDSTLLFSWG